MSVGITLLYGALVGVIGLALQSKIGPLRGRHKVSLETGGHKDLTEAIRRHGNWAENAPYVLLMMALLEINGASEQLMHAIGMLFLASRLLHPIGIDADRLANPVRIIGMAGTVLATVAVIVAGLWQVLWR
jgi:uncharacterized membrane protein YecN with MAPEG domain